MRKSKPSNRFKHCYNYLSDEMAKRTDEALQSLLNMDRPERAGIQKTAKRKGYFAYELGQNCRITYRPEYSEMVIEFFRLCSHKEAYGH